MFYVASKVLWFFLQPTGFLIFASTLGMFLLWSRWQKTARFVLTLSVTGLLIVGLTPIGYMLLLPLEERFKRANISSFNGKIDGVIILGGITDTTIANARNGAMTFNDRAERLTEAVVLARKFPEARIVFSGGSGSLITKHESEALSAARYLESMGVEKSRITLETESRNTIENARFSKKVLQPKPGENWLLVTSAFHMPRSVGCFRTVGFKVIPWPVDYNTRGISDATRTPGVLSKGMLRTDVAVREWIGLIAYWWTGRIPSLFPG